MSAGLAVVASNFPLWIEIVEKNNCGICVDPYNPKQIAEAIDFLARNPDKTKKMGQNGRRLVIEKYNWEIEEKKLLVLYVKLNK
jgi:glycosyltransferase involved in cell wall biosynthesis